ncbi:uncharacterized protein LOC127093814 [Lathyrus oleraceus]|uniref:uncharacterized protein LOC127093814 n=1 Tax=Pisum sativum TaxID=3888 RepID=UPI0021CE37B5|nr:uncharacterized protein LOC127093814 [Pisum sativum]
MQKVKETWEKKLADVECKAAKIPTKEKSLQKSIDAALAYKKELDGEVLELTGTQFHNRIISRSSTDTKDIVRNFSVPIENDNLNSVPIENDNLDSVPIVDEVNNDDDVDDDDDDNVDYDIFDPRNWDRLQPKLIDLLVVKGPKRDNSIVKGPRDSLNRRFTANLYTRALANGEVCDRD